VFVRDASVQTTDTTVRGVRQPMKVAGLAYGDPDSLQWGQKARQVDFYDMKGDVEALLSPLRPEFVPYEHPAMHPGRCASIRVDGQQVGVLGELHPRWRQQWELPHTPLLFEIDLDTVAARKVPAFEPVPKFQPAERDLAVIVGDHVTHSALLAAIRGAETGGLLRDALLFDVYKPQQATGGMASGEKSLAVRLTLASPDATLTDDQIESAVRAVVERIASQLGGRLRG
jgi:phenylalanyl-tRNA synthetase beta chain